MIIITRTTSMTPPTAAALSSSQLCSLLISPSMVISLDVEIEQFLDVFREERDILLIFLIYIIFALAIVYEFTLGVSKYNVHFQYNRMFFRKLK